jgi:hypothetical protein
MLHLTEITRRSTTDADAAPIRLNRHAISKVEEVADAKDGPRLKIYSDELPTMTCQGSLEALDEQLRELEARENGDAGAVAELVALIEALTARVGDLENNMREFVVR